MKKKMPTFVLYSKEQAEVCDLQSSSLELFFRLIEWISVRLGDQNTCYTLMIASLFKSIYERVSYIETLCIIQAVYMVCFG